ncbi:MAG: GrpB family protein [Chloroflexota bacterium]
MMWKNLGTADKLIEIVPYNSEWPELFELEARRIKTACEGIVKIVEHIGSTAIPGMPAKPILDLMPGLDSYQDGLKTIEPIKQLGYGYFGEYGIPGRFYFKLSIEQRTVVHVHMFEIGTGNWHRHLIFRDQLRADPAIAAQYAELKKELAVRFRKDREAYSNGKSEFINSVVQNALLNIQDKNA